MYKAFLQVTQVIVSGIRDNVPVHFFYLFTDFLDPEFIGPYNVNLEEVIPIYCPRLENMTLDDETKARRIKAKELGLKFWTAADATINCAKFIPHEFVHSVYYGDPSHLTMIYHRNAKKLQWMRPVLDNRHAAPSLEVLFPTVRGDPWIHGRHRRDKMAEPCLQDWLLAAPIVDPMDGYVCGYPECKEAWHRAGACSR